MNIAFPENVGSIPRSRMPLRFAHVLAIAYCFGGVASALYLLSKFVVTPLFEQLTLDRRMLADETRERLVRLNALLASTVSRVPGLETSRSEYVERVVQTDTRSATANEMLQIGSGSSDPLQAPSSEETEQYVSALHELLEDVKSLDPNGDTMMTQASVANQANELAKYLRSVKYEAVPASLIALGAPSGQEGDLAEAVTGCKQEIRALKSAILSG